MNPEYHLNIRTATVGDIDSIIEIELFGSALWKREYFEREFETDFSLFLVAETGNDVIGFAVAWDVPGEIQLQNIGVHSDYRRKGIGTCLLKRITEMLKSKEPEKIILEFKETNISAGNFYHKLGFTVAGMRNNYYGSENAVLMEKIIPA